MVDTEQLNEDTNEMDFDELLIDHVGECGRYQKFICLCLAATGIPCAFATMELVFLTITPPHWCDVGSISPAMASLNESTFMKLTIPDTHKEDSYIPNKCLQYDRNYMNATESDISEWLCFGNDSRTAGCSSWTFKPGHIDNTLVTEVGTTRR